jgi:hypothetical protein
MAKVIYFDWVNQVRVLANGSRDPNPVSLYYGEVPSWEIHVVTVSGTTLTAVNMSTAIAFASAVDDDFAISSDPWVRVLDADIVSTNKAAGIVTVPVDSNTSTFATGIGTSESALAYFELRGLNAGGELVFYVRFAISAKNTLDPAGGVPPAPTGNYYTKTESDAKYLTGAGALDIEITDASAGLILKDRTTATRYRFFVDNGIIGIESV